jgi:hypothetical protein
VHSLITLKSRWFVIVAVSHSAFAWAAFPPSESRPATPWQGIESPEAGTSGEGSLLEAVVAQNRLMAETIRSEVENELRLARTRMEHDPTAVEQVLKLMIGHIAQAPELSAEVRANLRGQLETALREAHRQAATKDAIDLQVQRERAGAIDRQRITGALARHQERVQQLMDRFDSLMDEGRFRAAEESAAAQVAEIASDLPLASSATLTSRQTRSYVEAMGARAARQKGVVDTLCTAETTLIPQPDDQPITYPYAPVWEELTLRRRGSAAVDMKRLGPAEARIRSALGDPTTIQFVETPLQEVVDYLKDLHGIEIQLDRKALEEARIGSDTPVTQTLKGISLRSALRHMLGAMELTYVIRDEALVVTTSERAAAEISARVYPVADLVIPILSTSGGAMGGPMGNSMTGNGTQGNGMMNQGMNNNMMNQGNMNRGGPF